MPNFPCPNCGASLSVSKTSAASQFNSVIPSTIRASIPGKLRRQLARPAFHIAVAPFTFIGSIAIFDFWTAMSAWTVLHTGAAVFLILPKSEAIEDKSSDRPKPQKSIVLEVHHNPNADYHVNRPELTGITEKQLVTFAHYALRDRITLNHLRPKNKGKPFSDTIARRLLHSMNEIGYLRKKTNSKTSAFTVTAKGQAFFRGIANKEYKHL